MEDQPKFDDRQDESSTSTRNRWVDPMDTPEEFVRKLDERAREVSARELEHERRLRRETAQGNYTGLLGRIREIVSKQKDKGEQ